MQKKLYHYFEYIVVYTIWLMLIVLWNFGYSKATPLQDVLAAILFAIFTVIFLSKLKLMKDLYF